MTDGSNTSNANGVPIQGGSTGIYEDHPGLNPTDEMVVEHQAGIREQMSELMRMDGEHPEVVAAAERVHGESDNIAFLRGQLEDLRAHGRESEAFKIGVPNDADLPGGGNPAGSSGGVDLANGNEAGSSAGVDLMNVERKYEHADRLEPDTPDPNAPVEADSPPVEADSPPVKGRAEGGPSKKRGRGEDSSEDDDGGDPLVPGESPDPGGFTSFFF
jgi:hypothetical protein